MKNDKTYKQFLLSIAEGEKLLYDEWIDESILWGENKYKKYGSLEKIVERLEWLSTQPVGTTI